MKNLEWTYVLNPFTYILTVIISYQLPDQQSQSRFPGHHVILLTELRQSDQDKTSNMTYERLKQLVERFYTPIYPLSWD